MLIETAITKYGQGVTILDEAVRRSSVRYGVETNLARAVAFRESSYNPGVAKGDNGQSIGPFQVKLTTGDWMKGLASSPDEVKAADIFSIEGNAVLGIYYLHLQLKEFGDPWRAVAAYNWGPGNVTNKIKQYGDGYFANLPSQVQEYVKAVQRFYSILETEQGGGGPPDGNWISRFIEKLSASLQVPEWVVLLFLAVVVVGLVFSLSRAA
jgi:soluble lytic murein transglycosylase-like protein